MKWPTALEAARRAGERTVSGFRDAYPIYLKLREMEIIKELRLNAEDFRYDNANEYASHGVLMLNAALDLENYARWTEHLETENQRLVDKCNALTRRLEKAKALLEKAWPMQWADDVVYHEWREDIEEFFNEF